MKNNNFYLKIFNFLVVNFLVYMNRLVFVMSSIFTQFDQDLAQLMITVD